MTLSCNAYATPADIDDAALAGTAVGMHFHTDFTVDSRIAD